MISLHAGQQADPRLRLCGRVCSRCSVLSESLSALFASLNANFVQSCFGQVVLDEWLPPDLR